MRPELVRTTRTNYFSGAPHNIRFSVRGHISVLTCMKQGPAPYHYQRDRSVTVSPRWITNAMYKSRVYRTTRYVPQR